MRVIWNASRWLKFFGIRSSPVTKTFMILFSSSKQDIHPAACMLYNSDLLHVSICRRHQIGINHGRGNLRLLRRWRRTAASHRAAFAIRRHSAGGEHGVAGVDSCHGAGSGRRLPAPAEKPRRGRTHPRVGVPGADVQEKEGTEVTASAAARSLYVAGDAARRRQGDAAVQGHDPRLYRPAEYRHRGHALGAPAASPQLR